MAGSLPSGALSAARPAILLPAAFMVTGNDERPSPGATTRVTALDRLGTPGSADERPRARACRLRLGTKRAVTTRSGRALPHMPWPLPWPERGVPMVSVVADRSGPVCGQNARTGSRGAVWTSCLRCP